jgi:hypothetical protein
MGTKTLELNYFKAVFAGVDEFPRVFRYVTGQLMSGSNQNKCDSTWLQHNTNVLQLIYQSLKNEGISSTTEDRPVSRGVA